VSPVFCVTDTSVVLVMTTIAASSAMAEMGAAAAPTRSESRNTKSRAASGVNRSKLSATPGCSWRFARSPVRATFSAARVSTPSFARPKMLSVGAGP
jgi:hypothetical protein